MSGHEHIDCQCQTRFEEADPCGCEATSERSSPGCGSSGVGKKSLLSSIFNFLREMRPA